MAIGALEEIGRREFVALVGGATAALPFTARAQRPATKIIGYLNSEKQGEIRRLQPLDIAFRAGLLKYGYVDGVNVEISYRYAETQYDRLPELAADLVHRQVDVIFATGNPAGVVAAKAVTATIPMVFVIGADPVEFGIVPSLSGSGGNVTGVRLPTTELTVRRLELLHEIAPAVTLIGWLHNPSVPRSKALMPEVQARARSLGVSLKIANVTTPRDIEAAFAGLVEEGGRAVLVGSDPLLSAPDEQLVALAARYVLPAIYPLRQFVDAGGLMSYEASTTEAFQLAAGYVGRILTGEKPADLPVWQPTRFELAVNRNTARWLGIEMPKSIMSRAEYLIN